MIISGNTTGYRPILRQLPASYMEPLRFSFTLDAAGLGDNVEFGLCRDNNTPIIKYNLRSGFVYDYSGRLAGTYQSGNNTFNYNYYSGNSWQYINERLVSSQDSFPNYTGTPFEKFYVKNNSSSPIDLSLDINGFIPPTEYSSLSSLNLLGLTGYLRQSGIIDNPSQGILYQIFDISVPSQYGTVNYFQSSGTGQIQYTITGGSYAADDLIPVTFNTYWGQYTIDIPISGSSSGPENGASESGIFLNLYGEENLVSINQSLDFYVDYFSSSETPVTLELEVTGGGFMANLSGTGQGFVHYEGYIVGTGTVYSVGPATGIADLFSVENSIYNTQYELETQYLNISKTGNWSKDAFYTGVIRYNFDNIRLTGTYEGPNPDLIGRGWDATGSVQIDYEYTADQGGFATLDDFYLGYPGAIFNGHYFNIYLNPPGGTGAMGDPIKYPNTPAFFPTSPGRALLPPYAIAQTGKGFMSFNAPTGFVGEGTGRVQGATKEIDIIATGSSFYQGNINDWMTWEEYPLDKPDTPTEGGALIQCGGLYSQGVAAYGGELIPVTTPIGPYSYEWGYGAGSTEIVINSNTAYVKRSLAIPLLTGVNDAGVEVIQGFTGDAVGYMSFPTTVVSGPTFLDSRNETLTLLDGTFNSFEGSASTYFGRSCIFGEISFSLESIGLSISMPELGFIIQDTNFSSFYESTLASPSETIYLKDLYPYRDGEISSIRFVNETVSAIVPDVIFEGQARVGTTGAVGIFNLLDGLDEDSSLNDYTDLGWYSGNKFIRPTPEIFPAGSQSRYVRVDYLGTDTESEAYATLRVISPTTTGEIFITGNGAKIR